MLNIDKDVEQLGLSPLAGRHVRIGLQINHYRKIIGLLKKEENSTLRPFCQFCINLNIQLLYNPTILPLHIYPQK